ncbi:hypothetical protein K440DRAFT_284300 [Wilcoxina mikolae CBS 423.85]|nr:hypothetical protein K440DRAFT_284300 [Wilcoxina mikolae CBS 423.85]
MSFGFSVGDFVTTGQLAWQLYRDYYRVARFAPQEIELLRLEISTLHSAIQLLKEEIEDEESILRRSGDDRVRMVNEMMGRVAETLRELERVSKKYDKLMGTKSRPAWKQVRDKFRFSVDAPDLDALRNKLLYHNGVINLLLTSVGNSSLQRLETTTTKIETRVNEIKDYLRRSETGSLLLPSVSGHPGLGDDEVFKETFSAAIKKKAQISQPWASIGLREWIEAGRWWLLKVRYRCSYEAPPSHTGIVPNGSSLNRYSQRNRTWNSFPTWIPQPRQSCLDIN